MALAIHRSDERIIPSMLVCAGDAVIVHDAESCRALDSQTCVPVFTRNGRRYCDSAVCCDIQTTEPSGLYSSRACGEE